MKNKGTLLLTAVIAAVLIAALLVFLAAGSAYATPAVQEEPPFPDANDAAQAAVEWLVATHQNDDGGFTSFSTGADLAPSDVGGTVDAILAIAGGGHDPAAPFPGQERAPVQYLQENADTAAAYAAVDGASAGKLLMALVAADQEARNLGGYNFVITLTNHLSPTGQYNVNTAFNQSLALLGLAAVGETIPDNAVQWLVDRQADNGSWDDGFGTADNADATAMSIMALIAADLAATDTTLAEAAEFLAAVQTETGGWEYAPGFGPNANSTALVIQALSALSEDVTAAGSPWAKDGVTPLAALLAWQSESGAFQADFGSGPFDDFFTTVQAIPAVAGNPYPLSANSAPAANNTFIWVVGGGLAVILLVLVAIAARRR